MASLTPLQQEEQSLQALAVVLQHLAVAADQRNICTLLQVSKTCRTAVQQSAASMLDCTVWVRRSLNELTQDISFAGWLAKHAGLVRALKMYAGAGSSESAACLADTQQLVEHALQVAGSAPSCRSGSIAPLCLQSYTSSIPATAGLIAALPAATLTHLDLGPDSSNWFSSLSRLANLQQLRLGLYDVQPGTTNSCLQEIGKLQHLTSLQLEQVANEAEVNVLPKQLRRLDLEYRDWDSAQPAKDALVDLQHLTSLQHLQLTVGRMSDGSALPVNLQTVELYAQWPTGCVAGFSSLHQVTAIELTGPWFTISMELLEALQHLPQLRNLSLFLQNHEHLLEVAAVWHKLPLCALGISYSTMAATVLQQLMQHVATATKLTKLEFSIHAIEDDDDEGDDNEDYAFAICKRLQVLKHPSSLVVNISVPDDFVEDDVQHLSTLTTLTSLELASNGFGPYVDEASLCCLASSLTALRSLVIDDDWDCSNVEDSIDDDWDCSNIEDSILSALPAIGKLSNLEELQLRTLPCDEARRGLHFLTGLSGLTSLGGFKNAGEAALQEFRAVIRGLKEEYCR